MPRNKEIIKYIIAFIYDMKGNGLCVYLRSSGPLSTFLGEIPYLQDKLTVWKYVQISEDSCLNGK